MRPALTLIKDACLYASSREVDVLFSNVILALGKRIPVPKGIAVELYNAEGRLLVPGLIDLHTHPVGGGGAVSYTHLTLPTKA